eukprot:scaffold374_cov380-Prasinococcus_capsulatus_cf.AAC.11
MAQFLLPEGTGSSLASDVTWRDTCACRIQDWTHAVEEVEASFHREARSSIGHPSACSDGPIPFYLVVYDMAVVLPCGRCWPSLGMTLQHEERNYSRADDMHRLTCAA